MVSIQVMARAMRAVAVAATETHAVVLATVELRVACRDEQALAVNFVRRESVGRFWARPSLAATPGIHLPCGRG